VRFLLVLASVLGSVALAGPTDAEAEAAARRILSDPDYQVELPTDPPTAEPTRTDTSPREEPRTSDTDPIDTDSGRRPIARFLWYLLIVVIIGALILWAAREWMDPKLRNVRTPPTDATPRPATHPGPAMPDHAALAAAGEHAEAIHALLLATLREVHRRAGSLAPAWTSREILYRIALEPAARDGLEEIVRAVERSRFGGAAVGAADYEACARHAAACRAALPEKAA
jgi:hypothetical protein